MMRPKNAGRAARDAETAKVKHNEGSGSVPNITEDEANDKAATLKEAMHELEEEKGDWSKSRG